MNKNKAAITTNDPEGEVENKVIWLLDFEKRRQSPRKSWSNRNSKEIKSVPDKIKMLHGKKRGTIH